MIKCTKILATGCYKRFAWFEVNGQVFCVYINDNFYHALKMDGVPTSQSLREKEK